MDNETNIYLVTGIFYGFRPAYGFYVKYNDCRRHQSAETETIRAH